MIKQEWYLFGGVLIGAIMWGCLLELIQVSPALHIFGIMCSSMVLGIAIGCVIKEVLTGK